MKSTPFTVIALWALLGSFVAPAKEAETILSGILPDLKNESIRLLPIEDYFPGLNTPGSYPTAQTDSLGRYTFRFTTTTARFYQVVTNRFHWLKADVYLEPGDSIDIDQSARNEYPKFLISGKGSSKLKHLEKDFTVLPKDKAFYDKIRSKAFPTAEDFKRFIDSIHVARINALSSCKDVPELLKAYHINTLKAERAQFLLQHLETRNYYMKETFDYFYPEAGYLHFLDSIAFDNDFAQTTAARMFIHTYLDYVSRKAYQSKTEDEWWEENLKYKLEYVARQTTSLWTDLLALATIRDYSVGMMAADFFNDLNTFYEGQSNRFFNSHPHMLFEANAKPYELLAPGNPAPDFALPDANGQLKRLSDLKGSIVYIDFWGTWCYPCIQEIPEALKLQEKYKEQPVTFLYVALEYDSTNIAGWKEFIASKNARFGKVLDNKPFPGSHVVAEKQFDNECISAYKLNLAPTYVLVDQHGKIVKARADRPKEIYDDIDALLKTIKTE